ncbi:MAG TPA: ATP-binding cassette domain-containing protein [Chroococcales cyanobacterium]|jgi:cobalt/nickel transport system ATP-binding protein
MSDSILELKDLEYHYPSASPCLKGIDLTVRRGKNLAVLGANGAGKTTLLLQFNGTLRPSRGTILLEGEAVDYSRQGLLKWRQKVGLVFQNPDDQLFAGTVLQDVSFGPRNLGLPIGEIQKRVGTALAALGIGNVSDRPTHMLSFGQKKRVALAGAIAMQPSILILDEPTAGLDPRGAEQFLSILGELKASGVTLILSTHDIDLAYEWADEVLILGEGAIVGLGQPGELLRDKGLLATSSLTMPWVLELSQALQKRKLLGDEMPRSRDDLLAQLKMERES